MADTKDNARNELTYVEVTPPVGESALRLPSNYIRAGMVISDNLAMSTNMIPSDDKDSGEGSSVIPGRTGGSVQIQGNRPMDGNAGQTILRQAWIDKVLVYFLKSDNTIGNTAQHGTAYVENWEENSDDESVRGFTCTLNVQGVPTWFTIQT